MLGMIGKGLVLKRANFDRLFREMSLESAEECMGLFKRANVPLTGSKGDIITLGMGPEAITYEVLTGPDWIRFRVKGKQLLPTDFVMGDRTVNVKQARQISQVVSGLARNARVRLAKKDSDALVRIYEAKKAELEKLRREYRGNASELQDQIDGMHLSEQHPSQQSIEMGNWRHELEAIRVKDGEIARCNRVINRFKTK